MALEDHFIHLGARRYLAEHIPNAKLVVLPGEEHIFFVGDTDAIVDEIEEFLTGCRSEADGQIRTVTVLFTDKSPQPSTRPELVSGSGRG